jgi:hypothetical protein
MSTIEEIKEEIKHLEGKKDEAIKNAKYGLAADLNTKIIDLKTQIGEYKYPFNNGKKEE